MTSWAFNILSLSWAGQYLLFGDGNDSSSRRCLFRQNYRTYCWGSSTLILFSCCLLLFLILLQVAWRLDVSFIVSICSIDYIFYACAEAFLLDSCDVIVPRKLTLLQRIVITIHVTFGLQIVICSIRTNYLLICSVLLSLGCVFVTTMHTFGRAAIMTIYRRYVLIYREYRLSGFLRPNISLELLKNARASIALKQRHCIHHGLFGGIILTFSCSHVMIVICAAAPHPKDCSRDWSLLVDPWQEYSRCLLSHRLSFLGRVHKVCDLGGTGCFTALVMNKDLGGARLLTANKETTLLVRRHTLQNTWLDTSRWFFASLLICLHQFMLFGMFELHLLRLSSWIFGRLVELILLSHLLLQLAKWLACWHRLLVHFFLLMRLIFL